MKAHDERRKNYFIDKAFQVQFILKFCILVIAASAISGGALYLLSRDTVTTAFIDSRLSIVTTADYILPSVIASSVVAIILISIATFFVVMYLSHRIAGPLFNIERSIKDIASGDLSGKIHLRAADEIQRLASSLNDMTDSLKSKILDVEKEANNLEDEKSKNLMKKALEQFKI